MCTCKNTTSGSNNSFDNRSFTQRSSDLDRVLEAILTLCIQLKDHADSQDGTHMALQKQLNRLETEIEHIKEQVDELVDMAYDSTMSACDETGCFGEEEGDESESNDSCCH